MTAALNNAGRYRRAASHVFGADNVRIASGVIVVASGAVVELTRLDGETGYGEVSARTRAYSRG